MTSCRRVELYAFFAVTAMALNLCTQKVMLLVIHGPWSIYVAIGAGTAAGLILKFTLDARFVFAYAPPSPAAGTGAFASYCAFSGLTTAIFWGFELGFHWLLGFGAAKYIGGGLGLIVGYTLKYQLDRKFVFSGVQK